MHFTHTMVAFSFVALAANAVVEVVLPDPPPPPPIVINALSYDAGLVVQDRTVNWPKIFHASWESRVIDVKSGMIVDGCSGDGKWDYAPGSKVASIPLAEWVGSASCKLEPGQYQLFAKYKTGGWATDARSDVFEVRP